MEDLYRDHGIVEEDLEELIQSILSAVGLPGESCDYFGERPDVRTIEGIVMLVDFADRLAGDTKAGTPGLRHRGLREKN